MAIDWPEVLLNASEQGVLPSPGHLLTRRGATLFAKPVNQVAASRRALDAILREAVQSARALASGAAANL